MFNYLIGGLLSFLYSLWILPKSEGNYPKIQPTIYPIMYKGMIIIPYNKNKAIHLHHWILYLLICIASIFIKIPQIIIGFSFGLFIQGLQYNDYKTLICKNPYK